MVIRSFTANVTVPSVLGFRISMEVLPSRFCESPRILFCRIDSSIVRIPSRRFLKSRYLTILITSAGVSSTPKSLSSWTLNPSTPFCFWSWKVATAWLKFSNFSLVASIFGGIERYTGTYCDRALRRLSFSASSWSKLKMWRVRMVRCTAFSGWGGQK